MLKIIFVLIPVLVFGLLSFRTESRDQTDPLFTRESGLLKYKSEAYTGRVIERFPDGSQASIQNYKDGVLEGESEQFSLQHKRISHVVYHKGLKEGLEQGWYFEGPLRYEFHFQNGKLDGLQTQWHLNGKIFRQETFSHGQLFDKKILFSSGEIFTNYVTHEGRIFGQDGGNLCMESKREGAL